MALSESGATIIGTIFKTGGDYLASKSQSKQDAKTASEQRALIRLQQEEQSLRNEILRASIGESNARVPLSGSALSNMAPTANIKSGVNTVGKNHPAGPAPTNGIQTAGIFSGPGFIVAAVILLAISFMGK
jgi:hypothetical protein